MISYVKESGGEYTRRWEIIKYSCVGLVFIFLLVFFVYFRHQINFRENLIFSLSTAAVAAILAGTYFFTYRFFHDDFYFFIFVSWVANAVYLIPELNGPQLGDSDFVEYKTGIYLLSTLSSLVLILSIWSPGKKKPSKPTWIIIGGAVGAIGLILDYVFITRQLPLVGPILKTLPSGNTINVFPHNEHIRLAWIILPGSFLSFCLLWAVGLVLHIRLKNGNHRLKEYLVPVTFYIYATLQFVYPFTPYLQTQEMNQWLVPFLIAQLTKVANVLGMLSVLQSAITNKDSERDAEIRNAQREVQLKEAELRAQEAELWQRRHLVELGTLTSSIKHDINTPLATMSFDIGVLKEKFQHDNKIVNRLKNLEESMERIYAIVKVVDIVRGGKEFFDSDAFMVKASMLEVAHRAVRSVKNERSELKRAEAKTFIRVEGREAWVRAFVPMLEQVIVNVIKNGLEAIDEAKRERGLIAINIGTTTISNSPYSRWVKTEIEDNGCGIPLENLDKLTTLFTSRSHKKPNSGIGLFIGKKIMDIHDGELEFESKVGEGTKVTLLLPEWNALQKVESQDASRDVQGNVSSGHIQQKDRN